MSNTVVMCCIVRVFQQQQGEREGGEREGERERGRLTGNTAAVDCSSKLIYILIACHTQSGRSLSDHMTIT